MLFVFFVSFPFEYFSMFFSLNVCMNIVHIYFNVLCDDINFFLLRIYSFVFYCMIIIIISFFFSFVRMIFIIIRYLFISLYCCLLEFRVCFGSFFCLLYPRVFLSVFLWIIFIALIESIMLI